MLNASQEEARLMMRLVNSWNAAQTLIEQLRPVLDDVGLLNERGGLNTDRVVQVVAAAKIRRATTEPEEAG